MPSLTRRQMLAAGAGVTLTRLLSGRAARAASGADQGGVVDLTFPIAATAFRHRLGGQRLLYTPPLRSPQPLVVLGLSWHTPRELTLELRTRRRGRWSRWVTLPRAGDHGPDRGAAARATEAAAVGWARVFQLRAAGAPQGLTAHGVAVAERAVAAGRHAVGVATSGAPAIIPRSGWQAQAPRTAPQYGEVQLAFVHHTVSTNDYLPEESAAIMRAIQHYHRNVLGWNDIGYQLLVDRHGQVFEGRAGGIDQAVVGAQAQGYNSVSTGVAIIGTHSSEGVSASSFEALAAVLAWKLSLHGVPTLGDVTVTSAGGPLNRFPTGSPVRLERISGHRDGDATACPGEALYAQLPALRARAAQLAVPTGLSLAVNPRRTDQLVSATASGLLRLPDGAPGVGIPVELQARGAAGWATVATSVTDQAGAWSTALALPYTRTLRALATAPPGGAPLVSPRVRLEVRSAISAGLGSRRLRAGRRTVVKGTVEPRQRVRRLIVTLERRAASGRYLRVARFSVVARDGRFRVPLTLSRAGLFRVRISMRGDRLNASSRSAYLFARALP